MITKEILTDNISEKIEEQETSNRMERRNIRRKIDKRKNGCGCLSLIAIIVIILGIILGEIFS